MQFPEAALRFLFHGPLHTLPKSLTSERTRSISRQRKTSIIPSIHWLQNKCKPDLTCPITVANTSVFPFLHNVLFFPRTNKIVLFLVCLLHLVFYLCIPNSTPTHFPQLSKPLGILKYIRYSIKFTLLKKLFLASFLIYFNLN